MKRSSWLIVLLGCAVFASMSAAGAAEMASPDSKVVLTWDQFKKITGWDGQVAPGELLLPWPEVEKMLDVKVADMEGAKVKLPWREFRALVEWSIEKKKGEDKVPPPADYVISKAVYAGSLTKDLGRFDVTLSVDVLRKAGWKRIPVLPAAVGVDKAELPQDAYLNVSHNVYEVLTQASGKMEFKLSFAAGVSEDRGMSSVSFARVPSGMSLLELTTPLADVDVKVANAERLPVPEAAKEKMLFVLPADNRVAISWERALAEVAKVPPKLYAQTQTLVAVGDGLTLCRERIAYSIVHAGVRELALAVPAGVNVLEASGESLHDWRVEGDTLKVQLDREVKGVYYLDLTFEKPMKDAGTLETPVIRTNDTERERGFVAVVALANVEITGEAKGSASSIDAGTLPPELVGLTNQPVLLAYRYVGKEFSVPLKIEKHTDVKVLVTLVRMANFTVMQTLDGRRIVRVVYDVRNNRNQFLRITMPDPADAFEVWSVSVAGKAAQPARDENKMILISLIRSTGEQLTTFPVEIVYLDKSFKPGDAGQGKIHIDLPRCDQPIMRAACDLYLPAEGRYDCFAGTLKRLADAKKGPRPEAPETAAADEQQAVQASQLPALQVQNMVDEQLKREAPAGVAPIKVNLPISGVIVRFHKVLLLDEPVRIELDYTHWPGYKSGWLW